METSRMLLLLELPVRLPAEGDYVRHPRRWGQAMNLIRTIQWLKNFVLPPRTQRVDLKRRSMLTAGAAGLGTALLVHTSAQGEGHTYDPALIRPPGSTTEDEFLGRCIRCGECMKVCPTN